MQALIFSIVDYTIYNVNSPLCLFCVHSGLDSILIPSVTAHWLSALPYSGNQLVETVGEKEMYEDQLADLKMADFPKGRIPTRLI